MICFHFGYPKAGSTTLQKALFDRHSQLVNLGIFPKGNLGTDTLFSETSKAPVLTDTRLRALHDMLVKEDGVSYQGKKAKELWGQVLDQYQVEGKTTIFSNEAFLSVRFSNPELLEKFRRVQSLCEQPKILIIIRSQLDLLKSLYRDHPYDPRTLMARPRPVSFSEFLSIDMASGCHSHTNSLHFDRIFDEVVNLFGEKNVLMLPLELLSASRDDFCGHLAGFLGIDMDETITLLNTAHENRGVTKAFNRYRKLRQYAEPIIRRLPFLRAYACGIDRSLGDKMQKLGATEEIRVDPDDMRKVQACYSEGNKVLAKRIGFSLGELGYLVL